MPQVDQVPRGSKKKSIIAAAVAGAVIISLIVAVFVFKSTPPDTSETTKKAIAGAADKAFSGNDDAAIAQLQEQLKQAKTSDEKVALYMAMGASYETKSDNKTAVETYKKAGALQSGFGINEAIARSAEAAGDKATALDYLKRNRQLIKDGKASQHNEELSSIEDAITRLGGKL